VFRCFLTTPLIFLSVLVTFVSAAAAQEGPVALPSAKVTVSYPIIKDESARRLIAQAYQASLVGGACQAFMATCSPRPGALDEALAKSAFIAAKLFRMLDASFPGRVVLRPTPVILDPSGKLATSVPYRELPSDLRVDILAYSSPYQTSDGTLGSNSTFGSRYTVIAVSNSRADTPIKKSRSPKFNDWRSSSTLADPSALIEVFNLDTGSRAPTAAPKRASQWKVPGSVMEAAASGKTSWQSTVETGLTPLANQIAFLANQADAAKSKVEADNYSAIFSKVAGIQPYLSQIATAELRMTSDISTKLSKIILDGDFGKSMEERLKSEYDTQKRWTSNIYSAIAMGMAMGRGMISPLAGSSIVQANSVVGSEHFDTFETISGEQATVAFRTSDGERAVSAASVNELRLNVIKLFARTE
jgi:hypothetical protein